MVWVAKNGGEGVVVAFLAVAFVAVVVVLVVAVLYSVEIESLWSLECSSAEDVHY